MPNWKKLIVSGSSATLSNLDVKNAVTASSVITSGNITIDSPSDAQLILDRAANSNDSEIFFKTNGTTDWSIGTGQVGSDNDFTFKGLGGSNYIRINQSGHASFLGAVTASAFKGDGSALTNVNANVAEVATVSDTFTSVTSKTVTHNFETKNVLVSVYNNSDQLILPATTTTTDTNTVDVTFDTATTGRIVVAKGGHIVSGSANDANNLNGQAGSYYLDYDNFTNVPDGIVSGSSQVVTLLSNQDVDLGTGDLTATSGSIDNLTVNSKLQLGGAGSQFFAYNEDTIKVKFANWYSSNDRQYGMGQLWFETWFAAIDNGASRANRRIGFYLEEPDAGSTDSGTPGQHPSNSRFYVDINGAYLSGSLEVDGGITADGHFLPTTTEIYDLGSTAKRWRDLYLSGSTIDLGGTLITRDATGDINFKDSGTDELKVLRVKELEIGTGANKTKIRLDDDNKVSFEKSSDSSKVTTSNFFKTSVNAAAKYTITHSLGEDYPVVQIYGTDKKQVIPKDITSINTNTVEVEFDSNFTGTVVVKK